MPDADINFDFLVKAGGPVWQRGAAADPDDRKIVIRCSANLFTLGHFTRGEPHPKRLNTFHHVAVGNDIAGGIPNEPASRRCNSAPDRPVSASPTWTHRRRSAPEDIDAGAFGIRQTSARFDRAWFRGREQQPVDVRTGRKRHSNGAGSPRW